jgi:preprotein translocase subunit SecG
MILLALIAIFMVMLILIQRGKGGGLTGALGGMGGQSAFGTKAGDLFTKITMWTAFFWIVLAALTVKYLSGSADREFEGASFGRNRPKAEVTAPPEAPADATGAKTESGK